jgi:hypothetical protein
MRLVIHLGVRVSLLGLFSSPRAHDLTAQLEEPAPLPVEEGRIQS